MRRLAILALLVGCYAPSAQPGAPCSPSGACPSGQVCDPTRAPPTCVATLVPTDASTSGDGPAGDAAASACGTGPACAGATPICDTGSCRACNADVECASAACDEFAGTCMDETTVLYVAVGGDDTGECTRLAPCATVSTALGKVTATRAFIAVAKGTYRDAASVSAVTATISGASWDSTDSKILWRSGAGIPHVFEVANSALTFKALTLDGRHGATDVVHGTACTLWLGDVDLLNGTNDGLYAEMATVDLFGIGASGNGNHGVEVATSNVWMDSAYIDSSGAQGLAVTNSDYTIFDSIFTQNVGGVVFSSPSTPGTHVFDFNTVVYNNTGAATQAIQNNRAMTITNSIIAGNGKTPQVPLTATVAYCLLDDLASPGTGNLIGDPAFVSPPWDLHLTAASPARDKADPAATLTHDYDYDPRPQNGRSDIGADEF